MNIDDPKQLWIRVTLVALLASAGGGAIGWAWVMSSIDGVVDERIQQAIVKNDVITGENLKYRAPWVADKPLVTYQIEGLLKITELNALAINNLTKVIAERER